MENEKGISRNKKIIFAAIAAVLAVIVIIIMIFSLNTPFGKFKDNIENGEISAAESIYSENKDNEKFSEKCKSYLAEYTSEIFDKYKNKNIDFDEAVSVINACSSMYKDDEALSGIRDIEASRTAFSQGEKLLADKKYAEAIDMFSKIIEEDTENYKAALEKTAEAADLLCEEAVEKSKRLAEQEKFTEAYSELDALDFDDERIEAQKQSIISVYEEYTVNSADKKIAASDYAGAMEIYSEVPSGMLSEKLKTKSAEAEKNYVDYVSGVADEYIKNKNYTAAINAIEAEYQKTNVTALDKLLGITKNEYADHIIGQAEEYAANNDYVGAFRMILSAEENFSSDKLSDAEQKYRNLLDSIDETYTKTFDGGVTLTYTVKYYTDAWGYTAYKSFNVVSADLGDFDSWNGYVVNWVSNYAFPSGAAYEITRSQYEEMYLAPHEYKELKHLVRDSLYLSLNMTVGDDSGSSKSEIHMMELLYGTEVTAQSLFGGLFW
ncbi:MAG: hypothetical protein HDT21_06060 [Ruminococcus sp.]|nr:hypothetical protein [Ruminococcus sp.]